MLLFYFILFFQLFFQLFSYTWKEGFPLSCECEETGVTSTNCKLYDCKCSCDLNAGSCDYNCCCDPDCSSDQIDRFKEIGCDAVTALPNKENLCYSTEELEKVNPRSPVGGQSASASLDSVLCIERTNVAKIGDFYHDTNAPDSTPEKTYSYIPSSLVSEDSIEGNYDRNDTVLVYINESSTLYKFNSPGYFPLPIPDFTGLCNDNNYALFEDDGLYTCTREIGGGNITSYINQCRNGMISTQLLIDRLLFPTTPPYLTVQPTSYLKPIVKQVLYYDISTKQSNNVTLQWKSHSCTTNIETASKSYPNNCQFDSSGYNPIKNTSLYICRNAIKSIQYIITHQQSKTSAITEVNVYLTVQDVLFDTSSSSSSTTITTPSISQTYSIQWIDIPSASSISNSSGNVIKRIRSGNPGYIISKPVLYGTLTDNIINQVTSGLSVSRLPMNQLLNCPSIETLDQLELESITFGYDFMMTCLIQLNRQELINLCCEGSDLCNVHTNSIYSQSNGVPYFLTPRTGYIGKYGNSDPLDPTQWILIENDVPPVSNRRWFDTSSTCSGMITGLNYVFGIVKTGEKSNPQNKIVSVETTYTQSDLQMRVPAIDDKTVQSFELSITINFVFIQEEKLKSYTPPPPPGLLTVPYDIFYPFIGNSGYTLSNMKSLNYLLSSFVLICIIFII